MIASVGIHTLLGLLFFFIVAWKAPFPPAKQFGIELNFGLDNAGTGDVQPIAKKPLNISATKEVVPEKQPVQQEVEESQPKQEQPSEEKVNTPALSQQEESPDKTEKTNPENKIANPSQENKKVTTQQKSTTEQPQQKEQASTGATGNENKSTSQGDQLKAKGDQGNPQGKIDARALYGTPGGGQGGSSLDMAGWRWDEEPKPNDTSNENGKIVFEIKINDRGELLSVRTLEKTVSPEVERIYRDAVEQLTFSPLSSNVRPAPTSTGKITFIIKSR